MENKINIARFKEGSRTAEVKDIWQWDYGQILRIQGLNLPTAVEIHFSLDEHGGEAARRIGITKDGVTDVPIPDLMVENESAYGDSYYFFAYIYLTDETSGNTEYKIRAKVSTRSKPEGFVSGGNDTFAEILKTVNEIAEDKVDIPAPAKVGQVITVSDVDEEGKPTEFEAKDMSGGASEEEIRQAVEDYLIENPFEESDPTVPEWAKKPEKPTYTASEVGALPAGTNIPSKTSELQNDSGFLTEHQDLSNYARKNEIPKTASDVGADASGTAESKVSAHNASDTAHNDIRLLVQGLTERLNALADSDDETLDQMSEFVAYVKSNKSLIDAITTSKINVSDIIDNLTTNVSNKPLSAAQGVQLKALIDAITAVELDESLSDNTKAAPAGVVGELKSDISQLSEEIADQYAKKSAIPTKVSQLTNDSGYLTEHQDISGKAEAVSLIDSTSQAQANLTPAEILQAMQAGKILMAIGGVCTLMNYSGTSQVVVHRQYSDSNIVAKVTINSDKSYAIELVTLAKNDDLTAHTGNSTVHITADERKNWNAKSDFSGNYDDLNGAPSSMKNPFALKINGTSYDGSKEVNLVIEGGGASGESELLGETPLTLSKDISTINLVGSGDVSYAIRSPTVADLENTTNITYSNCKLVQQDGYVELQSTGGSGWYSNYADIVLSGLTIGESYVIYVDGLGRTDSTENHRYCGYYIACSGESYSSSNQIGSTGGNYAGYTTNIETLKIEFTATTESVCVRMYPSSNAYFSSGVSVSEINSIYINRAGSNVHTSILNVSGTFTDSKMLYSIPSGTTISSTPSCSVYGIITESGDSSKPMYGKTIVCFGDSLFGMYRGDTSASAYIQEITGATVHNVGFGGCRMSVHPSSGYAEFCMWALAKAIAENDWTSQDSAASSGYDYFPDQLALLESIDFSSVDAVVIHYGTNDFGGSVAIGSDSSSSDYTTLCGALRYSIEKLLGSYPELRIYISLPVFRFWTGSDGTVIYSDTYKNSQSNTLVEVVNAIADVAKEYNLPVIDCYHGLGINKANASTFLLDGTHHNEVGRKRFGNFIGSQIVANR